MSAPHLTFGISLSTSADPGMDPVQAARQVEDLGFDFLSVSDHPMGNHATFETWTLLTWVAAATSRIGLVPNVIGLAYRPPAMVAKMAETLDRLSRGRVTLGLGGGANDAAIGAFGLPVLTPTQKIEALRDGTAVIRGLWSQSPFSYQGKVYRVENARIEPKAQRDIPIWFGTYGPKGLALTGRIADGWSPSLPYAPFPQVIQMREQVLRAAETAGRDPASITCNYNLGVLVDESARGTDRSMVGSPEAVAERLAEFVQGGFPSFNFWPLREEAEQRERLAKEVVPLLRSESLAVSR
jgi:alkanesulfonate monooxygenase SsuD/methylene tetrahydromethanopterin reductase-like flavin-dependent oxidoreductase (luciferase family)